MVDPVLSHRQLKGGSTTRERFRAIFGISEAAARKGVYRIAAVSWIETAIKVDVTGRGFDLVSIWLMPGGRTDCYAGTDDLAIAYEGTGDGPGGLPQPVERLLQHVAVRLRRATLDRLAALLLEDPELEEDFVRPHHGGFDFDDDAPGPVSTAPDSAAPDSAAETARRDSREAPGEEPARPDRPARPRLPGPWGEFFHDSAIEQAIAGSFHFEHPVVHLFHGMHECLFVSPSAPSRLVRFHNRPWDTARPLAERRRARADAPFEGDGPGRTGRNRRVSTDMDDLDVITGATESLATVVEDVVAEVVAGGGGEIVNVHCSCLPMVMGEDVEAATEALRNAPDVPYLYSDQITDDQMRVVGDLLARARTRLTAVGPREGRFNLFGFPDGRATGELVTLVESLGAALNVALVPDVDLDSFRRLLDAELTVRLPSDRHRDVYRLALGGLDVPTVSPPAPWGLAATDAWLRALGGALGRDREAARAGGAVRESLRPRWDTLRRLTEGARLGVVVDERHAGKLLAPKRFYGLALFGVLREMGFGVDVLAYAPSGAVPWADALEAAWDAPSVAGAAPADAGALRLRPFSDRAELGLLLGDASLRAVYSDVFFDHRLTTSGTAQFSARDFEMGFAGALRTFERLAGLVALPFYRRYASALAAPRATSEPGGRPEPEFLAERTDGP